MDYLINNTLFLRLILYIIMTRKPVLIINLLIAILLVNCNRNQTIPTLKTGLWSAEIEMQQKTLPFTFELKKVADAYFIDLFNGEETIHLDEVEVKKDSLFITLHIFDIEIHAKIYENELVGIYKKNYIDGYELPFKAFYGESTLINQVSSSSFFNGKWEMTFFGEDGQTSQGVGIFNNSNALFQGTILTPVGDYRYLQGTNSEDKFTLNTFDGNHAFIFEANKRNDSIIEGSFWSGKSFHENFRAVRNDNASLPDANKLTYIKDGYSGIDFSFPDLNGNLVSLKDEKYQNKVVLVQIFGTWCPNCMDETKFYADWYNRNKDRGVEIIGLAYEAKPDFDYAKTRVEKMIEKLDVNYDFLIAGTYDKVEAAKTLPMLNHVLSFPTTLFINKKGEVSKIHTGFSGPATGEYYLDFKKEFNDYMDFLLDSTELD